MSFYETIFIVRQDMAPSQVDALSEKYTAVLKDSGGSVKKIEYCGLRTLAYPIKKNNKGHFVLMNVDASPEALKEVERQMYLSDDVIRYLSIRVDAHDAGPSALLKSSRNSNIREISTPDYRKSKPTEAKVAPKPTEAPAAE